MDTSTPFEIFLVAAPGTESALLAEAQDLGLPEARIVPGGVAVTGGWSEVRRANLRLRCATRVLARIASFRAMHLAQLDKRTRKVDWAGVLRPEVPVRVEATCRKSRIYHAGAATQRVERALTEELGATLSPEAAVVLKLRIDDDLATFSLDTSGPSLHKRGHKEAVNKAPMRETLAAAFLRMCDFDPSRPLLDPMCGSGTFPIEAAEIAAGLNPGRSRRFAFEDLAGVDPGAWAAQKAEAPAPGTRAQVMFHGSDRDQGAVRMALANAERAGVADRTAFATRPLSEVTPPDGGPGLVIANPPYGARIGNRKTLFALYGAFGQVMKERFAGWQVALVTSDAGLARSTGLPLAPAGPPVAHGGMKVTLYRAML